MNEEKIKQVTKIKNPKRVAASKKSYQERMLKMKKDILENAGSNDTNGTNDGSNDIKLDNDNDTNDISGSSSSTNNTKSNNDVYFYGLGGGLLIIAIVFLIYYKFYKIKPQSIEINKKSQPEPAYRKMI